MPTYEYECEACGHEFEKFQSMTDKPVRKCPECKKMKVQRLIGSGAGIIFKGSGFYETDYKRKGNSGSGSESGKASSEKPKDSPTKSPDNSTSSAKKEKKSA